MMQRLFVYGTLAPGRANAHVLASVPGTWRPASVRGRLFEAGWGAAAGYPAIVPDDAGEPVEGLIFESDELHRHWARLDAFEGEGYARVRAHARLQDGRWVEAWVYALNGHPLDRA